MSQVNLGYCIALISLFISLSLILFVPELKIVSYLLIIPLLVGIVLIGHTDKQEKGT